MFKVITSVSPLLQERFTLLTPLINASDTRMGFSDVSSRLHSSITNSVRATGCFTVRKHIGQINGARRFACGAEASFRQSSVDLQPLFGPEAEVGLKV